MLPEEGSFAPRKSECYIPAEIPALLLRSGHTFYGSGPSPLRVYPPRARFHETRRHQAAHINCSHDNRGICFDLHWRSVRESSGNITRHWCMLVLESRKDPKEDYVAIPSAHCGRTTGPLRDMSADSLIATIRSQICQ